MVDFNHLSNAFRLFGYCATTAVLAAVAPTAALQCLSALRLLRRAMAGTMDAQLKLSNAFRLFGYCAQVLLHQLASPETVSPMPFGSSATAPW